MVGGMTLATSAGHKLGQTIGNYVQDFLITLMDSDLERLAKENNLYCDRQGLRPGVRGGKKKVVWTDKDGNEHAMDYVLERNATQERRGDPVAFIEIAWRRYTKHSRNKSGEIEGALLHLRDTYKATCSFVGAVLAGEYTDGGIQQLRSHNIRVLHIPYNVVIDTFSIKGINLDYDEDANDDIKQALQQRIEGLTEQDWSDINNRFYQLISREYGEFILSLKSSLLRRIANIRILCLYGEEIVTKNLEEAINLVSKYDFHSEKEVTFERFEVTVRYNNNDYIDGKFSKIESVIDFLNRLNN